MPWLLFTNILSLLNAKPVISDEFSYDQNIFITHLSEENIIDVKALLAVTLYCLATETRFLEESIID